jgi:phosphopantothenoylcysteine decarboxylase/phosphopantothenate--cysteine ligase
MHPADDIRGSKSNKLKDKKIVLALTGSIAAVETVKLARELIRHDAEVIPVMSKAATKIIHPDAIWFATGKKPIVELTGATEHIFYCGQVKDKVDLLLICPCTANTISKIAYGIDDTPVTTFATTAIGSKIPILIVPAMHLSMYDHKILQDNIIKLKKIGINFVDPIISRNKAKMADNSEILANVFRHIGKKKLKNKKVLIIGGPTSENIDDVRLITNKSSGRTAVLLAKTAFYSGAEVNIWYGSGKEQVPDFIESKNFESISDLQKLIDKDLKNFDIIINCAAISDYIPEKQKGKISSEKKEINIKFTKAPKLISQFRKKAPNSKLVGFKLVDNKKDLENESKILLKNNDLDFVIGNTTSAFDSDSNEILIINKKGQTIKQKGPKEFLSNIILDNIINK